MRTAGVLFAIMAVTVWWAPLIRPVQSVVLVFASVMCFAVQRAIWPPRGSKHKTPVRTSGDSGKEHGDGTV